MTDSEFENLLQNLHIGNQKIDRQDIEIIETHISYLILLEQDVYKLKKTVSLAFVDFSSLSARQAACRQELQLNRRLAPDVYRDVLEVKEEGGRVGIGLEKGATIDYTVWMRRVDNTLEMDRLLEQGQVSESQVDTLALLIADFHQGAKTVHKTWRAANLMDTYNQLSSFYKYAQSTLGQSYADIIEQSCRLSDTFISKHIDELNQRSKAGYVRDLHGDLHSHNIFLTDPPVVFDCIEFDDDLRQIDVLNEIAFFLMDLEYYKADKLADFFLKCYTTHIQDSDLRYCMDDQLLLYYKMYRASVRAKVLMINAQNTPRDKEAHLEEVRRYLELVANYMSQKS
jgi:aminoglycoside phosphotransferase family enzyme